MEFLQLYCEISGRHLVKLVLNLNNGVLAFLIVSSRARHPCHPTVRPLKLHGGSQSSFETSNFGPGQTGSSKYFNFSPPLHAAPCCKECRTSRAKVRNTVRPQTSSVLRQVSPIAGHACWQLATIRASWNNVTGIVKPK